MLIAVNCVHHLQPEGLPPARVPEEGEGGRGPDPLKEAAERGFGRLVMPHWDVNSLHQPVTSMSLVIQSIPLPWVLVPWFILAGCSWALPAYCREGLRCPCPSQALLPQFSVTALARLLVVTMENHHLLGPSVPF